MNLTIAEKTQQDMMSLCQTDYDQMVCEYFILIDQVSSASVARRISLMEEIQKCDTIIEALRKTSDYRESVKREYMKEQNTLSLWSKKDLTASPAGEGVWRIQEAIN